LDTSSNDLETRKANRADPTFTGLLTSTGDASFNENVYIANDLTIDGDLKVKTYNNEYIINTTTTDYTLIVAEDLSINGGFMAEGDVSMNKGLYVKETVTANTITDGTATMSAGALIGLTDISASGLANLTNILVS